MRRTVVVSCLLLVVGPLAACRTGEEPSGSPTIGDGSSSAAEPSPDSSDATATAPSEATKRFDDKGHDVLRGKIVATNAAQQAVVDAWFDYWAVHMKAYGTAEIDQDGLARTATGKEAEGMVEYVDYLRSNGLHTVGDVRFDVSKVEVSGSTATIHTCMANKSVDRKSSGKPVEKLTPYYQITGTLQRSGEFWLVADRETTDVPIC